MKKLFLSFAVIAGLSMISCGNKAENANEAEATDSVACEEVAAVEAAEVVDTLTNDTTVVVEAAEAAAPVAE